MQQIKQYGTIGIVTHFTLSWSFLAGTYIVLSRSKNPQKIIKYFKLQNKIPQKAGNLFIAGIIYKAVMPARLAISAVTIPIVIKMLGQNEQKIKEQNKSHQKQNIVFASQNQTKSNQVL